MPYPATRALWRSQRAQVQVCLVHYTVFPSKLSPRTLFNFFFFFQVNRTTYCAPICIAFSSFEFPLPLTVKWCFFLVDRPSIYSCFIGNESVVNFVETITSITLIYNLPCIFPPSEFLKKWKLINNIEERKLMICAHVIEL